MPNPGTKSLPFGTSGAFTVSFLSVPDVVVVLGAAEFPVELVVLLDAIVEVLCTSVVDGVGAVAVRSCTVTDSTGAIDLLITEFGFVGLIGLIGLTGLFIFVVVIVHVSDVVDQAVHVGVEYGSEHVEERFCIIDPL
jgi:hypothetical protein